MLRKSISYWCLTHLNNFLNVLVYCFEKSVTHYYVSRRYHAIATGLKRFMVTSIWEHVVKHGEHCSQHIVWHFERCLFHVSLFLVRVLYRYVEMQHTLLLIFLKICLECLYILLKVCMFNRSFDSFSLLYMDVNVHWSY